MAIVIYSIGMGLVLHLKPALMFHASGAWKEFGYQRGGRYTLFPFWLFAVVWGFVSYVLATVLVWMLPVLTLSTAAASAAASMDDMNDGGEGDTDREDGDAGDAGDMDMNMNKYIRGTESDVIFRRSPGRPRKNVAGAAPQQQKKPRQGYYVLDPAASGTGLRKYIYYGPTAPPVTEVPPANVHAEMDDIEQIY